MTETMQRWSMDALGRENLSSFRRPFRSQARVKCAYG
jgi:hypothetical protein